MESSPLGRPELPEEKKRDARVSVYLADDLENEFLALFAASDAASKSAFGAEIFKLGLAIKRRQLAATADILSRAA